MFPDISSSFYIVATASFVLPSRNTFVAIMNIASFKGVEKATVKSLLLMEAVVVSKVNLASIFGMIVNSEFTIVILF
jgi:hypothetical protein